MKKRDPVEEAGKWAERTRPARKALAAAQKAAVVDPVGHSPFQRKKK